MVARYVEYMNIISKDQLIIFIWLGYLMNQTVFRKFTPKSMNNISIYTKCEYLQ